MRDGDARGERKLLACRPRAPFFSSSTYYAGYPRFDSRFMVLAIHLIVHFALLLSGAPTGKQDTDCR